MKKCILSAGLLLMGIAIFAQAPKANGTIYMEHPLINVVYKSVKAYMDKDIETNLKIFADTAQFWASSMEKPIPIKEALEMWNTDADYYDDIAIEKVGYPDFLQYNDKGMKYVQSWWQWVGKSKKTGEVLKIDYVQFDKFNKAGKIEYESIYGDFSKMIKE